MSFDLDRPNDASRFALVVSELQQHGVQFYVVREQHQSGEFSRYAKIVFGKEP